MGATFFCVRRVARHFPHPRGPPITGNTTPLTYDEHTGAARNTKAGEISSGCAGRPMSLDLPNCATFSAGASAGLNGVHTGPGATQFTRMPRSSRLLASALVKAWTAPFVAA